MASDPKIVNLRQVRKEKSRAEARATADSNAAKFGRSKLQRLGEAKSAEKDRRHLDGHLRVITDEPK